MLVLACGLFAMLLLADTAAAAAPTFDSSFGCSVATPCGSFTSWTPTYVAVNHTSGDVYVTDQANDAIEVFDASGNYLSQILAGSTTNGTFAFGGGIDDITVDNSGGANDGRIYVESTNAALVFAFDSSGTFLWQSNAGGFVSFPGGISVDPAGNPWVADVFNGIQQLSPTDGSAVGNPLLAGDLYAQFVFGPAGGFAAVQLGGGVDVYDANSNLLHSDSTGLNNTDVALETATNSVYTVDANGVTIWDSSGNVVAGTPFGPTNAANSVAVDSSDRKIYLTEPSSGKVDIYDLELFTLGVTANGTGSGRVDVDAGRISGCTDSAGTCSDTYIGGSTVTLSASPGIDSNFTGWTGCDSPSGNSCTVTLTSDRNVTATFDLIPRRTLRVAHSGTGSGTVTSAPSGIDCGSACQADYLQGDPVSLTARPAPGSTFTGWSGGGCSGVAACQVTMSADTDVTAAFAQSPPAVSTGGASGVTQSAATVSGTVNPNGAATTCTFEYGASASYGASVPCASAPGSGTGGVAASASLSGLAAGTAYHYRLVASNSGGTTTGSDATFTTASPPPTCQTNPALCARVRPGVLHLVKASVVSSGGKVVVQLSCVGGTTCRGSLKVTAKVKTTSGKGKSRRTRTATVVIAKGSIQLGAGRSGKATLKLTSTGRHLLAKAHKLSTTLAGAGLKHTLVIRIAVTKSRKRH